MINILNLRIKSSELDISGIDFKIENIDVLEYPSEFKDYFVIANIPYYITSPILRHFLYEVEEKPEKMLILMQKDVGEKILGKPHPQPLSNLERGGAKRRGEVGEIKEKQKKHKQKSSVLSLFVQKKCDVREVLFVGKENFIPAPKVESAVLLFELHDRFQDIPDKQFLEFIKKGFKEPRKKLLKNFVNSGFEKGKILKVFEELGIDENVRGEDLSVEEWCELFTNFTD